MPSKFIRHWLDNPILHREIKNRLKLKKISLAFAIQLFFLCLIFILLLAARLGRPAKVFFLAETLLIVLMAPLLTSNAISREQILRAEQQFTTPLKRHQILLGKLIGMELYPIIFLTLSFFAANIFAIFQTDINWVDIARIHLIFLIYLYACGALGIFCSTICKNALYATEMAYLILALLISNVVLITPFIRWGFKASTVIPLALYANPFTPICAILKLDIFRIQGGINLYNLSPVASYGWYAFPAWYKIGFWYVLGMVMCLVGAVLRFKPRIQ